MLTKKECTDLNKFAVEIRKNIMISIASVGKGHVGGSLSIVELLAVLYGKEMKIDPKDPKWEDRDTIVISKGHSGPAMYAALALKGYFPKETLTTLNENGTILPSHTDRLKTPGVDMSTGSLGQGASTALGLALADKKDGNNDRYTYLVLGDGECQEGQVWESLLFASHQNVNNLITFVDNNKKQLDGYTEDICNIESFAKKFEAFGYNAIEVEDGHDVSQIYTAIKQAKENKEKPSAIILNTIKGKGVTFYEEMLLNHSAGVTEENLQAAIDELDMKLARLDEVEN